MTAIFNEIEPYAAQWLTRLSDAGHVITGRVDTRSIREVQPDDVRHAVQFHAFAGIGVWSYALRLAGWPDDRPVWTGSCPCQPFSVAGRGKGADDERHLWPEWSRLIRECRPPVVFGEQVASPDGLAWLDAVRADLEGAGYAFGAADLCAAGVGAPHIRQRLYFVGIARDGLADDRREGRRQVGADLRGRGEGGRAQGLDERPLHGGSLGQRLGRADGQHARRDAGASHRTEAGARLRGGGDEPRTPGAVGQRMGDSGRAGLEKQLCERGALREAPRPDSRQAAERAGAGAAVPTSGFWSNPDWVACRDGKQRPVEPGTFPLAHGAPQRVGRLRAYGNAIVSEVAATFIKAVMEASRLCRT